MDPLTTPLPFALGSVLVLWSGFWVIRLAVRYGVDDALRKHREITGREHSRDHAG